jgi:hypothetical protein
VALRSPRGTDLLIKVRQLKSPGIAGAFLCLVDDEIIQIGVLSLLLPWVNESATLATVARQPGRPDRERGKRPMRKLLLTVGFLALALGLLWIGQGTGVIAWPQSSFMINQIQWAGYGAALAALGLILIWQSKP